ncbi:MAG TPA: Eco57I restriction-modification methylase domain-containing protein, partial [Rubrivivax sp.]|nr:Eco57I restriction-modification methylase domain-containing protein [Rubrivivax sp.]
HTVNAQPWAAHLAERGRPWTSPVIARLAFIRQTIKQAAAEHRWSVSDAQLDDRQLVRRMILKKSIYGVDKNPMAVELAKTALWLHTFTVGAPLSFLDHHLKCGDSLHGEKLAGVRRGLQALGMLFQQGELDRIAQAASRLARVADLTDVDIAEARLSKQLAHEADAQVAPLHALLDFWRALRWLLPGWPAADAQRLSKLGDEATRAGLTELLSDRHNLLAVLAEGRFGGDGAGAAAANALLSRTRALAAREAFFHWWSAFPTVFDAAGGGGFDVVVGNPPWDRIKLQQVEWFAEREPRIALQARAADRKRLIAEQQKKRTPLWQQYAAAVERAEANARVLAKGGDYPLLGGGDVNLYSLFVERATALVQPEGIVALLTPSGIAADKGAAPFFRSIATRGRLGALFDFENGKVFFRDVHASFKFCALVFGGEQRRFESSRCAFYLHAVDELAEPERKLSLSADDFALVNPNTGAAPVFRSARDASITLELYRRHPVLVRHRGAAEAPVRAWPLRYLRMFDMTNDSGSFVTAGELSKRGWRAAELGQWQSGSDTMLPLYEGKMVQLYDHRAADVIVNPHNLHRPAQPQALQAALKERADRYAQPQYYVRESETQANPFGWALGFKEITAPTNVRTMIAAVLPKAGFGNTLPLLIPETDGPAEAAALAALLVANLNSMAFDFVARTKVQGQHLNWYILEQLPVIAPERFEESIGSIRIADFVREQVLRLSYTAHDLAAFARDLGHVDARGGVLPPFAWDDEDRRRRIAALDGLFMHLYGLNENDAAYVLDTFPIVREQDERAFGRCRTKDEVLAALRRVRSERLEI